MDEHPGVVVRDGATGRRAVLVGGPDVRDVIRVVKAVCATEPDLDPEALIALVQTNTGVPVRLIDTAVRYWAAYPDEIDAWIDDIEAAELQHYAAWERQQQRPCRHE